MEVKEVFMVRNHIRLLFIAIIHLACTIAMHADETGVPYSFNPDTRYSQLVINSRLNDFYANNSHIAFSCFDENGNMTQEGINSKGYLDYVPGLVAKAVLEAVDYYKDNKEIDARPWFYAVQHYANKYDITSNGKAGKSFDDLNAVKIYSKLLEFASNSTFADGASYTNAQTIENANKRFKAALEGIRQANNTYVISTNKNAAGGWWHKSSYDNQMWCDGQYMGPALLAQIINDYGNYTQVANNGTDWNLITKQIDISWNYLWNSSDKLLYHAFSATPTAYTSACWASLPCPYDNTCATNTAYWGRANGWYMLALVDIMEQMEKAGLSTSDNYRDLHTKLNTLAEGIAARQEDKSGCWYQLLDKDGSYSSNGTSNYLESSASAIFTAAYLKGIRLGYYEKDYTTIAKKAYKGLVNTFMTSDGNGGVHIIGSCRSAGLGGSSNRKGDCNYYLNGSDVKRTTNVTEGKVLGAFILAATEYERIFIDDNKTANIISHNITAQPTGNKVYNIAGQEVTQSYKGLIITNGRKRINSD